LLLRTLEGVAADAAALPGPPPAALPTLQDLLTRFSSDPVAAPRPGGGQPLRARLTGSAAPLASAARQDLQDPPPGRSPIEGEVSRRGARNGGGCSPLRYPPRRRLVPSKP
jgi:hypothetical protein